MRPDVGPDWSISTPSTLNGKGSFSNPAFPTKALVYGSSKTPNDFLLFRAGHDEQAVSLPCRKALRGAAGVCGPHRPYAGAREERRDPQGRALLTMLCLHFKKRRVPSSIESGPLSRQTQRVVFTFFATMRNLHLLTSKKFSTQPESDALRGSARISGFTGSAWLQEKEGNSDEHNPVECHILLDMRCSRFYYHKSRKQRLACFDPAGVPPPPTCLQFYRFLQHWVVR